MPEQPTPQNQIAAPVAGATPRVAAVVVTRNRLDLLRRCLDALRTQSRALDAIFVVDVASTDNTPAFLKAQIPPLEIVRLETNAGGAGGFHAGIEAAFEAGYDWVWLMDDDGYAASDALEKLLSANDCDAATEIAREALWLNSLVVQIDDPSKLAFDFPVNGRFTRPATAQLQAKGRCLPDCCPFNGTLIHRSVIERIGSPNPAFFIWGDEQEYKRRALGAGVGVFTITDSLFYHPASNAVIIPAIPIRNFWKHFYHVRNHGASANKAGEVKLSAGGSYGLGRAYIKTLVISLISSTLKIFIVLAAMTAALVNNTKRPYPK